MDTMKEKVEVIEKKNIKCRYNDRGFCRSRAECVYYHADKICDKLLSNGQCPEPKTCFMRHPRDCRYWKGDTRGCLREQPMQVFAYFNQKRCKYQCKEELSSTQKWRRKENGQQKDKGDTDSLNKDVVAKEDVIKEKEDIISKLESENEGLIEENHRIKRCAFKMDQEIKVLRSLMN